MTGFNNDPTDYTTGCTGCGNRFEPKLRGGSSVSNIVIPFFCPAQVLQRLHGLEGLSPEQLRREHPAVYHSAMVHHGGIKAAFEKGGIPYAYSDAVDWKGKTLPFLGQMPDTLIVNTLGVALREVRVLRRKHGIRAFRRSSLLG